MNTKEIKDKFIEFFKSRGHTVVPSSSLVPTDPTLLFTTAGMVQFKKLWTGEAPLIYTRAVSIQKCMRTTDLDEVGKTGKHLTFFEMLGNFSFGDYFKNEAINFAWEFLTNVINLKKENLYISVWEKDVDAYEIWKNIVEEKRIYKLGDEDNFWSPPGGGACGPCSEILYNIGDTTIEVWNIVFPQYELLKDGRMKELKNKGIDTGMGLERLLAVANNKKSVFETELFIPIINESEKIFSIKYDENKTIFNILADHVRALTFGIASGVYPGNFGRGYVLRHIIRRAQSKVYEIGIKKPFLYKLVPIVTDIMKEWYPELVTKREIISLIIKDEEESFIRTLEKGRQIFIESIKGLKSNVIPGEIVFKLYDTYGFPKELTEEIAKEKKLKIDSEKFNKLMSNAKLLSKAGEKFSDIKWNKIREPNETEFLGYETLSTESNILLWRKVEDNYEIILDRTPFYGEKGGQIGDKGKIYNDEMEFNVISAKFMDNYIVHIGKLNGEITHKPVFCEVNKIVRQSIARNHTATHLLHSALKRVLGEWVHQEGSLVGEERLRFDFTHFNPLTEYEKKEIDDLINFWINENIKVECYITNFDNAIKHGAIALFGEKYEENVRVVKIGDISIELCGGTHLNSTGEIGVFKLKTDTAIHRGIRRVEAVTGKYVIDYFIERENELNNEMVRLNNEMVKLNKKIRKLENERIKILEKEIGKKIKKVKDLEIIAEKIEEIEIDNLRLLCDKLRKKGNRVCILATIKENKPIVITSVSENLKEKLTADKIAKEIGKMLCGGGGGKPTLAQAGGKDIGKLSEIINKAEKIIKNMIKTIDKK